MIKSYFAGRRWARALGVAGLLGALCLGAAQQAPAQDNEPAGCTENQLGIGIATLAGSVFEDGGIIKYRVRVSVSNITGDECQVRDITGTFTQPGPNGTATGTVVNYGPFTLNPGQTHTICASGCDTNDPNLDYTHVHGNENGGNQVLAKAQATGTAQTGFDDPAAAQSQLTRTIVHPDLLVVKTAVTPVVNAGETATFTIDTSNEGVGNAPNAVLTDTLPGSPWVVDAHDWDDCAIANGNELTCTDDNLAPGASRFVTVSRVTTPDDCSDPQTLTGTLFNEATAETSSVEDPDNHPNTDDAEITVLCPDVTVDKTAVQATINAGDEACFDITTTNLGPGVAFDVTLTDTLPGTGWSITAVDAGWGCNITTGADDLLECSAPELAVAQSCMVTVCRDTTTDDCADPGPLTGELPNTAAVAASNEPDTVLGNNEDSDTITVLCPDLQVVKDAVDSEIDAIADQACFTMTTTNIGPGDASNATLSDTLPGTGWVLGAFDWDDCQITGGNQLECADDVIAAGASRTVAVCRDTTTADCGLLENTAVVAADNEPDTHLANNTDDATITVNCPDLTVNKVAVDASISAGEEACFTIVTTNNGPGAAVNVVLTDTLPGTGWVIDSADAGWNCNIAAGADDVLTCTAPLLADGASCSVTVCRDTTTADCGELPNQACVSADNEDPAFTNNNCDDATITVNCADLIVEKTADNSPISAGEEACFTMVTTNIGIGTATNAFLTDTLPGTGWAVSGHDWDDCQITAGADDVLDCSAATMLAGESRTVSVCRLTDNRDCGELPNCALVGADNEPPDAELNNEDCDTIVVNCPNITVDKVAVQDVVTAPNPAGFTMVTTNLGPGTAFSVTLSDTLPGTGWSIDAHTWDTCQITAGANDQLDCSAAALAQGAQLTVTVSRPTVSPDECGVLLENEACVFAENEDPTQLGDNCDDAVVFVECFEGICVVIIDEDTIDNGISTIEAAAASHGVTPDFLVNDDSPTEGPNPWLRWNEFFSGDIVILPGGEVKDEGWFALPADLPWDLQDYVAGLIPQSQLDKIPGVQPLQNHELLGLVGQTCVAVVYDSDISINYKPLNGNLQGARYGLFAFTVLEAIVPGALPESTSSTSLYDLRIEVLPCFDPGTVYAQYLVDPRDGDIDDVELKTARYAGGTLTIHATSKAGANADMRASVDGFGIHMPMTFNAARNRWELVVATGENLKGRRVTVYSCPPGTPGDADNGKIK